MIYLEVDNWWEAWLQINRQFANNPIDTIDQRCSARGVSFDNIVKIRKNEIGELRYDKLGYTAAKLKSFDRKYVIPGLKEEIGELLIERKQTGRDLTVLSYSFNQNDKSHTQGPCVINILITMVKSEGIWFVRYKVNMRIAEITKRMAVDFLKFQQIIKYWNSLLEPLGVHMVDIEFDSAALYGQPLWTLLAEVLYPEHIKYDIDSHWYHAAVKKERDNLVDNPSKHKMANRVRRYINYVKSKQEAQT